MAFKIYRLLPDHRFWKLTPPDLGYFQPSIFAVTRLEQSWPADPAFGIENPSGTVKGDFVNFEPGTLAFGETVYESGLGESIAYGGEILSGHIGGSNEPIFIYNALTCYNCLDSAGCIPALDPDQVPGESEVELVKYAFHPERMGGSSLFKVPESIRTNIFLQSHSENEESFYSLYHALGFKGLLFEEVWSDAERRD